MKEEYQKLLDKAKIRQPVLKRHLLYLTKFNHKNFDHVIHDYHDEVFSEISCLECGNCCKTLGAVFKESDIKHVSKYIGMDVKKFVREYLDVSEEFGYVTKLKHCPFCAEDNTCSIYEERPQNCMDYPHTLERAIERSLGRLLFNTLYCPAAYLIAEKIVARYAKESLGV